MVLDLGLRSWLLGDYAKRIEALETLVKELKDSQAEILKELKDIHKALGSKANYDDIKDLRLRLNNVIQSLESLQSQIESLSLWSQREQILESDVAKKDLVLRLISKGYDTPKELKVMVPFGSKKLYEILRELERDGLIKTIKIKRRVYYKLKEEAY